MESIMSEETGQKPTNKNTYFEDGSGGMQAQEQARTRDSL